MYTHPSHAGSAHILALVQAHPVDAAIVDMSTGKLSVTLLCGNQMLRDVGYDHLQKLYELNQLPSHISAYLATRQVIAARLPGV